MESLEFFIFSFLEQNWLLLLIAKFQQYYTTLILRRVSNATLFESFYLQIFSRDFGF